MKQLLKIVLVTLTFTVLFSCASREKFVYVQNAEVIGENEFLFETKLERDDLLLIHVSAKDPESVIPFNLETLLVSTGSTVIGQRQQQLYLIDSEGAIDFPVLGKLELAGLTKKQTIQLLSNKLSEFVQDPIINLRIMNYKVSILGEVKKPGTYGISSERVTLLEALSKAGDLTVYAKRDNILIVREVNGKKTSKYVDITSGDFINSEFYYLKQNDIVYVEPNKTKINSSAVGSNTSVIISTISLLLTATALIINLSK